MQYVFANYPTGKQILRIGNDTLQLNDGKAEVDEFNPAQVALAEVYEGRPVVPAIKVVNEKQQLGPYMGRRQTIVKTITGQKRILITALRILNSQVRGVRLGNGSK